MSHEERKGNAVYHERNAIGESEIGVEDARSTVM